MATKKIFSINGNSINQMFQNLFATIKSSRFVAKSKTGNKVLNLPLVLVIIIAILFPLALIAGVVLSIIFKINISIEKEVNHETKLIEH